MHRLLKRQLKKAGVVPESESQCDAQALRRLLAFVDQTYRDADDDRNLLERSLDVSSREMQELYNALEQSARKSEAKYTRLIENLRQHYFFYSHDTRGVINYVSDSITDVLGYAKEEFLNLYTTYQTDDPMNEAVVLKTELAIKGEVQDPYHVSLYHKDGSVRVLEVMEQPVFDTDGTVIEVEGIARDVTQLIETQNELNFMAQHDPLTGISNRTDLFSRLEHLIATARRETRTFALLFIDLDHFKNINDTMGHDIGDEVLNTVVQRILPNIRDEDTFARIGGDEFVIVLDGVGKAGLSTVVNKIMALVRETCHVGGHDLKISTSIGVALYPADGTDAQTLLKNADIAMYKAKKIGRDNVHFFTEDLNTEIQGEMQMELDMAKGLEKGEFVLYFQPKMRISDNAVVGAEALLRWQHPDRGLLRPEHFIGPAENTGFIVKLGRWVIEEGCRAIAALDKAFKEPLHLSVNLSSYQLQHDDPVKIIGEAVKATGIDPTQLFIEITETVFIHDAARTHDTLTTLRKMGIKICLDDFGTGYSSFSYLHRFPLDAIKIDKSFVDLINADGSPAVLLDTILAMGQTLGLHLVAEGVEQPYQRDYLLEKGCEYFQGFLVAEPLPLEAYMRQLRRLHHR